MMWSELKPGDVLWWVNHGNDGDNLYVVLSDPRHDPDSGRIVMEIIDVLSLETGLRYPYRTPDADIGEQGHVVLLCRTEEGP